MKILCLHGSPGGPEDFSLIKKMINDPSADFIVPDRYQKEEMPKEVDVIIAYSWGSAVYLQSNIKAKKVIFISPFVFGKKKASDFIATLLSHFPFSILANKGIEKFLKESIHPAEVNAKYYQQKKHLQDVLPQALREKELITREQISKKESPPEYLIIYGKEDLISTFDNQIKPLADTLNAKKEYIEDGGHALCWSHPKELTTIIKNFIKG